MPHTRFELDSNQKFETNYIQKVKPILDSIFSAMKSDFRYKFNWAETVFFKEWYLLLDQKDKDIMKRFV